MMRIGLIGLGIMGRPMAKNMLKAGYALMVNDLNREAVEDVVSCGAVAAAGLCGLLLPIEEAEAAV